MLIDGDPYRTMIIVPIHTTLAERVREAEAGRAVEVAWRLVRKVRARVAKHKKPKPVKMWNDDAVLFKGPLRGMSAASRKAAIEVLDEALFDDGLQVVWRADGRLLHLGKTGGLRQGKHDISKWQSVGDIWPKLLGASRLAAIVSW